MLLSDLLAPGEERDRAKVFDIPLLASRLIAATRWLRRQPDVAGLPLAYFGASTGAAAALSAAAELGDQVRAVISRGGRPDLAAKLDEARAPTLLIVGGADEPVLALNRQAQQRLGGPDRLAGRAGARRARHAEAAAERPAPASQAQLPVVPGDPDRAELVVGAAVHAVARRRKPGHGVVQPVLPGGGAGRTGEVDLHQRRQRRGH